jgi:hypothetical protein
MLFRRILLLFVFLGSGHLFGQGVDFCKAISTIVADAPNQFRNIKGNVQKSDPGATIWAAGIKIPGGISARFVASMGLFYECAFFQTKKKEELKPAYEKYKNQLAACLQSGYSLSTQPNFYPGLAEYKKLVFLPEVKDEAKLDSAPAHIALEATYNKDIGLYTIVLYIFEH